MMMSCRDIYHPEWRGNYPPKTPNISFFFISISKVGHDVILTRFSNSSIWIKQALSWTYVLLQKIIIHEQIHTAVIHSFKSSHAKILTTEKKHPNSIYALPSPLPTQIPHLSPHYLRSKRRKPKIRPRSIENTIISIEENITINVLGSATNRLQRAKAAVSTARRSEVQERGWDSRVVFWTKTER